jgi:hypothetical protein
MTVTREEVLAQLETERKSAWAWHTLYFDLKALDDYHAYFDAWCLLSYDEQNDDPEWNFSIEDILVLLMKDGLAEHNDGYFHAVDIVGQLC